MKRVFIAVKVDPDDALQRMISTLQSLLAAEKIKWVDPVNIHITLAFLGDTEEKKIEAIAGMLKDKCSGFQEFDFKLAGAGVFKNSRDPRIIWAGITSQDKLCALENRIAEGLKSIGFVIEERQYKPHLTLGRVKSVRDTKNLKNILDRYSGFEFQRVDVKEVILYESILSQTGPIYKSLGNFPLS
jgi:RNA 2',3'-cyclic 3'-phosphodiesterase